MDDINSIFLARAERTMHPDLTCDRCGQQFYVGLEKPKEWPSYKSPNANVDCVISAHVAIICPKLVKLILRYKNKILCTKCEEGVLVITPESKFDVDTLLTALNDNI